MILKEHVFLKSTLNATLQSQRKVIYTHSSLQLNSTFFHFQMPIAQYAQLDALCPGRNQRN